MDISYTQTNVTCNGLSNGRIIIEAITLTTAESDLYGTEYILDWTDNASSLNDTNTIASNLAADTYGFRLIGNSNVSDYQYFTVTEPAVLDIYKIQNFNNPCDNVSSIDVYVSGGTPPYRARYGTYSSQSDTSPISITGIIVAQTTDIIVTDANTCSVSSDAEISTLFTNINYSVSGVTAPLIYDDHLSGFEITVAQGAAPYKFIIYESDNNAKGDVVAETDILDTSIVVRNSGNTYSYDLSELIYPGSYIIEIIDSNNCHQDTTQQTVPNSAPLVISSSSTSNTTNNLVTGVDLNNIYDTILIPYKMIQNDSDILDFIKGLRYKSKIKIKVGDLEYQQNIIKFNKDTSQYSSNILPILHLGPSTLDWFFEINISRGFQIDDNILTDKATMIVADKEYDLVPRLDNSTSSCKIIKGNFVTSSTVALSLGFETGQTIGFYIDGDTERVLFASLEAADVYDLVDIHQPGYMLCVNLLHSDKVNSLMSITTETGNFSLDDMRYIADTRKVLDRFNGIQSPMYIAIQDKNEHNGTIGLTISGGSPQNNTYVVSHKYIAENNSLQDIYYNNEIYRGLNLSNLPPGTYISKISDQYGNIPTTLNDIDYSDHYTFAVNHIINVLHTDTDSLDFRYGDILNIVTDTADSTNTDNTIASTEDNSSSFGDFLIDPVDPPTTTEESVVVSASSSAVSVTENSSYNNSLNIIAPTDVSSIISGPNGFSKAFTGSIQFINMPSGVYTIVGKEQDLYNAKKVGRTVKVYMYNNLTESITIQYKSYLNTFIIG